MRKRYIAAGAAVGALIPVGSVTGCGGSSPPAATHIVTRADVLSWARQVDDDAAFKAVVAETTNFDPSACTLSQHDSAELAKHHPVAPVDEKDWSAALGSLHDEIVSACNGDTLGAKSAADAATSSLTSLQHSIEVRFPGIQDHLG